MSTDIPDYKKKKYYHVTKKNKKVTLKEAKFTGAKSRKGNMRKKTVHRPNSHK